jgi:hypothetical protein
MQILQRNRDEIMADLNRCLGSCNLSFQQLAEGSRLSYHAARRYLTSRYAKNYNDSAKALCLFFGVATEETAKLQTGPLEWMTQTIHEVWDGSEPHARLIVELIKSTKSFKVNQRQ